MRTEDEPIYNLLQLPSPPLNTSNETQTPSVIIASIGDIALDNARPTLELVKEKDVDLLILNGDISYQADPEGLHQILDEVLGETFPVVITVGNHDTGIFTDYQEVFLERYNKYRESVTTEETDEVEVLRCLGEIGVNQVCSFKNLGFVLSGLGSTCMNDDELNANLQNQLRFMQENNVIWRTVYIHKNQELLQTGSKKDEVGYLAYELSIAMGAAVMNAHEHQVARTKSLKRVGPRIQDFVLASADDLFEAINGTETLTVGEGTSFVVLNGLGGKSIRKATREGLGRPWWSTVFHSGNDANYGAHFCEYNVNGQNDLAYCYFETVDGRIVDEYFVRSTN